MKEQLYSKIEIIIQHGNVYLHNKSEENIEELIYETAAMLTMDITIVISSIPCYQITQIPSKQAVFLEKLTGWEDGKISYYLAKVKTETITFEGTMTLKMRKLSGIVSLPKIADCKIIKLSSQDGFVVDIEKMNNGTINELYWLAEELKAYTDLMGSHFDTEKAQTKLWKMNSILSKNDFPKVQELQNNLLGRLEIPMFFDKAEFSKKVDELYELLEKLK